MKIIWITPILLIQSYLTIGSHIQDEYNQYSFYQKRPLSPRPLDAMADLTNDLGVCVLRILAAGGAIGNVGFSPFGLMAVSVLLYEGSSGYSALQIKQSLNLPWEILAVRIGVRDLNRYLKTYFKSDGFLNGLTMSRDEVCLRPQFKRVLRLYGFDDPNGFLIDSCPESATTTTHPVQQMSVTTHGTVITEIVPTSQIIQVSTNITNGTASEMSSTEQATELPARVTYMGDTTFTISNIDDTNTNLPMNSQTNVMVVDVESRPYTRPIESSTNQADTTVLIDELTKPSNKIKVTDKKPNGSAATETVTVASTTPITSDLRPVMAAATVTQTDMDAVSSYTLNSQTDLQLIDMTSGNYNNELQRTTSPADTSTARSHESTTDDTTYRTTFTSDVFDVKDETFLPGDSYTSSTKIQPGITTVGSTDSVPKTTTENEPDTTNDRYVLVGNIAAEAMAATTSNEVTTTATNIEDVTRTNIPDINNGNTAKTKIPSTKPMQSDSDGAMTVTTAAFETNTATTEKPTVHTATASANSEHSVISDYKTTTYEDVIISTTTDVSSMTTVNNFSNATENEIIKVAESNRHYHVAPLQEKKRSLESNDDNLPTFNVEFVVRKEDLRADCNQTRKRIVIKPDRILTEYPKNSGVSIKLRESTRKRKRRHLQQYQGYNARGHGNQWYNNGYKNYYGPPSGWIDRSFDDPFETNLFNAGYRRIPFFTYTAVLPFGFVFELKSQVIEIPLDDPKYTLMIIMPNHPSGLSELLLLLPTMSLRNIHNFLKPTAVHATIPTFKYTAKVDLTSALQQVGIQDVFYRYKADLSFMSPDARLFVSSVQQVVSVTAKKYNTPPVFEIQRKYVEHNFVVSRPFVYFVIDVHTKVSLIAGVITDPLASPIWV